MAVVDSARPELPCRVENPDLWFAETPADLERAKALCGQCPVRNRCLRAALDRAEPWGVWGGEIFDQGVVIARKRPRGRPGRTRTNARRSSAPELTTAECHTRSAQLNACDIRPCVGVRKAGDPTRRRGSRDRRRRPRSRAATW
ncbi:hypothetical protein GS451_21240 [Rhodococcus hoagii]|nr:hypothetical protein [Prescottella equi]